MPLSSRRLLWLASNASQQQQKTRTGCMTTGAPYVLSLRFVAAAATAATAVTAPPTSLRVASFAGRKDTRTVAAVASALTSIPATAVDTLKGKTHTEIQTDTAEPTMFKKANQTYQQATGAAAAAKPSPAAEVKRAMTLSSSPRNGSIVDFCKRPLNHTAAATTPLQARSLNAPSRSMSTSAAAANASTGTGTGTGTSAAAKPRVSGLTSLCGKSDSFTDRPPANPAPPAALRQGTSSGVVEVSENDLQEYGFSLDDFDDDEFDAFDIDLPSALPPKPAAAASRPPTTTTASKIASTGFIASSPPSSPSSRSAAPAQRPFPGADNNETRSVSTMKRSSPDGNPSDESPLPVAKKRSLPKSWTAPAQDTKPPAISSFAATPAPKHNAMWEATASAVKAQKKQLKDQQSKKQLLDTDDAKTKMLDDDGRSLPKPAGPVVLSNEQQHVKNLVCYKKASVFFTGPAGTGKSVLMRSIIEDLRVKYAREPEQLGVTASTGLAACNIGGMTLHSFAGIGLGKEDAQTLVRKIRMNPKARSRWLSTKTLIIDEVSMVDGDLFDKLSQIGRIIRKNGRPWGGIQLVLTGDFFQLPPVPDRDKRDVKFAFEAQTWKTSIDHTIGLTEVFRQRDPEFAGMLNEMRLGKISEKTVETFKAMSRPLQFNDDLEVTELFPTRQEVESSNEKRLKALKGKSYLYEALDLGEQALRERLLQNMMAPKRLELRVGAQVMLIKNMDEQLVNGSLGIVKAFMTEEEMLNNPMDLTMAGDPDVKKRTALLSKFLSDDGGGGGGPCANNKPLPYVEFHGANGSTRGILVRCEEWKSELPNGVVQASRTQLPLILAWALSIHKAQGQTLDRVKVDLGRVFEKGQAYVALSRATTKHGLQVLRFEKHKVMAHPRVIDFYTHLSSAEAALKTKAGDSSILAFTTKTKVNLEEKRPALGQVGRRF